MPPTALSIPNPHGVTSSMASHTSWASNASASPGGGNRQRRATRSHSGGTSNDDERNPVEKEVREKDRRYANNTRER
jgi:hypothetical protein